MTDIVRILIGPLVWLATFSAIYGLHGAMCGLGWGGGAISGVSHFRAALIAAWLVGIIIQVVVLAGLYVDRFASTSDFVNSVSRITGWAGLVATAWSLSPIVGTTSCA